MISKTNKMMDEGQFWKLISDSLLQANSEEEQEKFIQEELEKLNHEEIVGFSLRSEQLMVDAYTSELWCAGFLINEGCSDSSFDFFRSWLVTRGKEVYEKAISNPDSLADIIEKGRDCYFRTLENIAFDAFENKTGEEIDRYTHDFPETRAREIEFNWQEEDPGSMKKICPRLFEKMNG